MKHYIFIPSLLLISGFLKAQQFELLIGTYTNSCKSEGIYSYTFNANSGNASAQSHTDKLINPSFLTVAANRQIIYAVNENGAASTVSALSFDAKSGKFKLLNQQNAEGADPCHLINDDKNVLVANYSGGNISVFSKQADGKLSSIKQVITHQGKSINKQRQEKPHVHMLQFSPGHTMVLANDLGTDRIYLYNYQPEADKQVLQFKDSIPIKSGSGPRHLTFSPSGKFMYLLQELDGTLTVFANQDPKWRRIQETTVVENDFSGTIGAADIHISADGKFLYATNRGTANTISIFSIDSKGKLLLKKTMPSGGNGPRNFAIDPSGNYLLVAHQNSNNVVVFKRDKNTGLLTDIEKNIEVCAPVCLVFVQ